MRLVALRSSLFLSLFHSRSHSFSLPACHFSPSYCSVFPGRKWAFSQGTGTEEGPPFPVCETAGLSREDSKTMSFRFFIFLTVWTCFLAFGNQLHSNSRLSSFRLEFKLQMLPAVLHSTSTSAVALRTWVCRGSGRTLTGGTQPVSPAEWKTGLAVGLWGQSGVKPTPEAVSVSFLILMEHEFYHHALGVLCSQGIYTWAPRNGTEGEESGLPRAWMRAGFRDKWKPA